MNAWAAVPKLTNASLAGSALSEPERLNDLVDRLSAIGRRSTAEMLQELRRIYPDSPLSMRVAALEALRRR